MNQAQNREKPLYLERVLPNFGTFLAFTLLLPAITLVSEPFDFRIGLVVGSALVLVIWAALIAFSPVIWVGKEELRVGSAIIPRSLLGKVNQITSEEIFLERGPNLDPMAFKAFQGSVKTALKISIKDPEDPTPYWLFSTRKPTQLAAVLDAKA